MSRVTGSGKADLTCTGAEMTQLSFVLLLPTAEHTPTLAVTQMTQSLYMSLMYAVGVLYSFVSLALSSVGALRVRKSANKS